MTTTGSGKTTVIGLIASVVTGDLETLAQLPFEKVEVVLREVGGRKKPVIIVSKEISNGSPTLKCQIWKKFSDANSSTYKFNASRLLYNYGYRKGVQQQRMHEHAISDDPAQLKSDLNSLISVTWLSVDRIKFEVDRDPKFGRRSHLDNKVEETKDRLSKYFYQIDQEISKSLLEYQKASFLLPLMTKAASESLYHNVSGINTKEFREELKEIYTNIRIEPRAFNSRLTAHVSLLEEALEKLQNADSLRFELFAALAASKQLVDMIAGWHDYLEKRKINDEPRRNFLEIINSSFKRKKLQINDENEFCIKSDSGRSIQLQDLSSGEKQLFVLLAEALLQRNLPTVYIADEPELSLHLAWQESLVKNLKILNPSAQIIFATHSPDIVSEHSDSIKEMEQAIS